MHICRGIYTVGHVHLHRTMSQRWYIQDDPLFYSLADKDATASDNATKWLKATASDKRAKGPAEPVKGVRANSNLLGWSMGLSSPLIVEVERSIVGGWVYVCVCVYVINLTRTIIRNIVSHACLCVDHHRPSTIDHRPSTPAVSDLN